MSIADKARVLEIVLSKLKAEDITLLRGMSRDGITGEEIEYAKAIIKSRITEKEKDLLKQLYYKYEALLDKNQ